LKEGFFMRNAMKSQGGEKTGEKKFSRGAIPTFPMKSPSMQQAGAGAGLSPPRQPRPANALLHQETLSQ
jgi:hypothetical protein